MCPKRASYRAAIVAVVAIFALLYNPGRVPHHSDERDLQRTENQIPK